MANKYKFIKGGVELVLENITATEGLGFPKIDISSKRKGWRKDGAVVQWSTYQERIFSLKFDVKDPNAIAQRRAIYSFFADKRPVDFVATVDDKDYTLKDVYVAGDSGHDMPEGVMLPVVLQFMTGNPLFVVTEANTYAGLNVATRVFDNTSDMDGELRLLITDGGTELIVENLTTGQTLTLSDVVSMGAVEIGPVDIFVRDGENGWPFADGDVLTLAKGENEIKVTKSGLLGVTFEGIFYYASL